jgi:hypothetical protein
LDQQRVVLQEIARLSGRVVVMSEMARNILADVYDVPTEKVAMVPHGIPDIPFVDPNFFKDQFGCEGKKVLLTFGLLSPGKGIEYVIEALPEVVRKHPEVVYIVLGATHPHIKRDSGEEYRNALTRRVHELGLTENVMFQNRFVELPELCEFLGATDIYVTPYLNEDHIVSGTLAYALGAGKAVVSTPYWYATEMLADERGRLVPFGNPDAIAEQVVDLLDNETERHALRKRAYNFCRKMVWKRVAQNYLDLFVEATEAWVEGRHVAVTEKVVSREVETQDELPEILQHCRYSTPDRRFGYCTDDNSRALIVAALDWDQTHDESMRPLMQTYLSFLGHALDEKTGRFRNFLNYDRTWSEVIGSEDSHARALWGLGEAVAMCPHESMIALATRLFNAGLPATESFASPRAWAFAVVGIHAYLQRFGGDSEVRRYRVLLTDRLVNRFTEHMSGEWPWCEDVVTYANGKLGKKALEWLLKTQTAEDNMLSIIGTNGWYSRGGERARFDQQPVEAHALVDACIEAYHVTREKRWIREAERAFHWFLGDNDLRTPLYDFTTGGCRDGLHADRVNENQGAESTLAWLMSLLLMHDLQMEQTLGELPADKVIERRPVPKAIKASGPVVGAKVKTHARPHSDDK